MNDSWNIYHSEDGGVSILYLLKKKLKMPVVVDDILK
jgi:hypothetical protein